MLCCLQVCDGEMGAEVPCTMEAAEKIRAHTHLGCEDWAEAGIGSTQEDNLEVKKRQLMPPEGRLLEKHTFTSVSWKGG